MDAIVDIAKSILEVVMNTDPEPMRYDAATKLGHVGFGLLDKGHQTGALNVWTMASRLLRPQDAESSRIEASRLLLSSGNVLHTLERYEASIEVLQRMNSFAATTDGAELREVRTRGLVLKGICHWWMNHRRSAIRVWEQATQFVQPGDPVKHQTLVLESLGLALYGWIELGHHEVQLHALSRKVAALTAEFHKVASEPLQRIAQLLARNGRIAESIVVLRRAVDVLDESDEVTTIQRTLIQIAEKGGRYLNEIYNLMSGSRLVEDSNPLWPSVRAELGESVEALPAGSRKLRQTSSRFGSNPKMCMQVLPKSETISLNLVSNWVGARRK